MLELPREQTSRLVLVDTEVPPVVSYVTEGITPGLELSPHKTTNRR